MSALGLLLIRLVFGLTFAAHGTQKLLRWFGGYGLTGTAGRMESLGLKPGKLNAALAGLAEVAGGRTLRMATGIPVTDTSTTLRSWLSPSGLHWNTVGLR